ncbi:MAG: hypothetical protein U5N55_04895 [Cypionkella sp.]|nr:hypothetical protein [Cypionkella sp.]
MAIQEKTLTFAFDMLPTLADATVGNLTQKTIYIPEASPTFVSVFAEVGFQDRVTATGGTIGEHRVGLRLGAAAYTTFIETDDIINTAENLAGVISPVDFTAHFNANWTGTSMTCDGQLYFDQTTGTTLGMANLTMILTVTYTYDDTAATQAKTAKIGLQSLVASLPTTATNFATDQIPRLTGAGGMFPENGVVIRDWFLVIEGNENVNGATTDFTLSANIDGGATTTFTTQEAALASDRFCRFVYKPASVPDPATTHNLQLWSSLASRFNHVVVTLYVTYEFTLSGTTRMAHSVLLPFELGSPMGRNIAAKASRMVRDYLLQEPGTIELKQSSVRLNWNTNASVSALNLRVGAQAYRTYTLIAGVVGGMFSVQQRFDAASSQGAGVALARGRNALVVDAYTTSTANEITTVGGHILLNYISDVPAAGVGAAAHTVLKHTRPWDALALDVVETPSFGFAITPANYWLSAAGFCLTSWQTIGANAVNFAMPLLAGEGAGAGYAAIYADAYLCDAELGCSQLWTDAQDVFKRCPQDADTGRANLETARFYRLYSPGAARSGIYAAVTLHSMTWSVAGNFTLNNAALPTDLELVLASTGEVMQRETKAAGVTSFNFTVYDNTELYYVSGYQDGTHVGRSAPELAA